MQLWSDESDLHLFTIDEFDQLPDGIELECIDGTFSTKGKDYIDLDVRFNHMAYGISDPWNHPLKDKFLMFKLMR